MNVNYRARVTNESIIKRENTVDSLTSALGSKTKLSSSENITSIRYPKKMNVQSVNCIKLHKR